MWRPRTPRGFTRKVEEILWLVEGVGKLTIEIDAKLERVLAILEEDE